MNRRKIGYEELDVFLDKASELLGPPNEKFIYRDTAFADYLNQVKTTGTEFTWSGRFIPQVREPTSLADAHWWFTDEEYEIARELLSPYARVLIKMRLAK